LDPVVDQLAQYLDGQVCNKKKIRGIRLESAADVEARDP